MKKPVDPLLRTCVACLEVVVALNRVLRDHTPIERAWLFAVGGVLLEETLAALKLREATE